MLNCFCVADKCLRKRDGFSAATHADRSMISAKVKHAEAIKAKKGGIEYERAYG